MSSKVVPPDQSLPVSPFSFRCVSSSGADTVRVTEDLRREFQAQLAAIEQQYAAQVRDAHAAGVREGELEGRRRAQAELDPVLGRLGRTIDEFAHLRGRLRREAEADLIQLSLAIARRILRREVAVDPDALRGLVLAALEKMERQEICRVKVHPAHCAAVAKSLAPAAGGPAIEVTPDASCEPGGIIFETARGNLDASVESQLHEIERGLADRLRKSS